MTVKAPDSPAGLQEDLGDPAKLKALWEEGPEAFGKYVQEYADNFKAADRGDVEAQSREQIQAVLAEFLTKNREEGTPGITAGVPRAGAPITPDGDADVFARESARARLANRMFPGSRAVAKQKLYNKAAVGAGLDGEFGSVGEFFQAIYEGPHRMPNRKALDAKRAKLQQVMNSFGSEVPADGGFLIPEILRSDLLMVSLESAVVRPRARVIPMDSLRVPIPTIDDTSHVSNVFGGVTGYWTEEAAALTESQASFARVVLDAKKLTLYSEVPNELLADAPAFSGFFDSTFPDALAYFEDIGFFTGTGTGEPQGFINCTASVQVTAEAGQPTQTIVWENVTKMYARMLPQALSRAVWICAIDTFPQLATMALSVGTGGGPVWIGNFAGGTGGADVPPVTILGRPVIFTEKSPALGTTGDIAFVDLSYYLIGDRQMMQSMASPHYKFANDKMAFRLIERVDGRPWLQSAITPHNNSSNTLTPFVQLASR